LRVVRVYENSFLIGNQDVTKQIIKIFLSIFALIFIMTCMLLTFENPYRRQRIIEIEQLYQDHPDCKIPKLVFYETNFSEMLYFVLVTLSTVGYGDVIPHSTIGRFCVVALICIVLIMIP